MRKERSPIASLTTSVSPGIRRRGLHRGLGDRGRRAAREAPRHEHVAGLVAAAVEDEVRHLAQRDRPGAARQFDPAAALGDGGDRRAVAVGREVRVDVQRPAVGAARDLPRGDDPRRCEVVRRPDAHAAVRAGAGDLERREPPGVGRRRIRRAVGDPPARSLGHRQRRRATLRSRNRRGHDAGPARRGDDHAEVRRAGPAHAGRDALVGVREPAQIEPAVRERAVALRHDRAVVARGRDRQPADRRVVGVQRPRLGVRQLLDVAPDRARRQEDEARGHVGRVRGQQALDRIGRCLRHRLPAQARPARVGRERSVEHVLRRCGVLVVALLVVEHDREQAAERPRPIAPEMPAVEEEAGVPVRIAGVREVGRERALGPRAQDLALLRVELEAVLLGLLQVTAARRG